MSSPDVLNNFLDALKKEAPDRRYSCKTCVWYADLDPKVKKAFDSWIADRTKSRGALHRAATRTLGLTASKTQFLVHCRGECRRVYS
jgi:hypothetical protein